MNDVCIYADVTIFPHLVYLCEPTTVFRLKLDLKKKNKEFF